jgi:hypothetical protein
MSDAGRRTIPVEPSVHVETFAAHYTVTWKACSLARFLTVLGDLDEIPSTVSTVVDDTSVAGRERRRISSVEAGETVQYLRMEPDRPWAVSWERRTWPIVSVSGTPSAELCRRVHTETTGCDGWSETDVERLLKLTDGAT